MEAQQLFLSTSKREVHRLLRLIRQISLSTRVEAEGLRRPHDVDHVKLQVAYVAIEVLLTREYSQREFHSWVGMNGLGSVHDPQ